MADNAKWYVVHTYSGYENTVKPPSKSPVVNRGLQDMIPRRRHPDGDGHRGNGPVPRSERTQGTRATCSSR